MKAVSRYKNILLKLSGEALAKKGGFGIDADIIDYVSAEIISVYNLGIKMSVVIGGGNIFRGIKAGSFGIDRASGDSIGMLATVINALALKAALEKRGIEARIMSAIPVDRIAAPYIREKALFHLGKKRVLIFAGGTGNPYFTTDTAATIRALETKAEIVLKATKVNGLYDSDPVINKNAKLIKSACYQDVIKWRLKVMDLTAVSLAMENGLPLAVFSIKPQGNIKRLICGEDIGSIIGGDKND
ncbi:MAG: UMP kinase [Deltaproteobacteria bacterium]|nr:UMP kinase [Deltaproteobacteria bacterium]